MFIHAPFVKDTPMRSQVTRQRLLALGSSFDLDQPDEDAGCLRGGKLVNEPAASGGAKDKEEAKET